MKHRTFLFVTLLVVSLLLSVPLTAQRVEVSRLPIEFRSQRAVVELVDDTKNISFAYNTESRFFRFLSGQEQFIGWLSPNNWTNNCTSLKPTDRLTGTEVFGATRGNFTINISFNPCYETGQITITEGTNQFVLIDTKANDTTVIPQPVPPVAIKPLCAYSGTTGIKGWYLTVNELTGSFTLYRVKGKNLGGRFAFGTIYRGVASIRTKGDVKVIIVEQTTDNEDFLRGVVKFNLATNTAVGSFFDQLGNSITINDRNILNNQCSVP